jgi:ATP-dependent Clp protease protease subunit
MNIKNKQMKRVLVIDRKSAKKRKHTRNHKPTPYSRIPIYNISDDDSEFDSEFEDVEDFWFGDSSNVYCRENRIYFRCSVTNSSVDKLVTTIDDKNKKFREMKRNSMVKSVEPQPLYLHITSYGGDLIACFRAIDAIIRSEIPIYTVIDGHAASAGTLMSVVGKKRYMTPHSYMLIHQLSSGASGKFWEIKDEFKNCEQWMEDIYNIYLQNTKMSLDELKEQLSHDSWWSVEKCLEKGLVDKVYTKTIGST